MMGCGFNFTLISSKTEILFTHFLNAVLDSSGRRLIDYIASGKLTVLDRPDKKIQAFQEKLRKPIREQRQAEYGPQRAPVVQP